MADGYASCATDPNPERRAEADALLHAAETMFGRRLDDVRAAVERGAEDAREHLPVLRSAIASAGRSADAPRPPAVAARAGVGPADGADASVPRLREVHASPPEPATAVVGIVAEITRAILAQDDINGTLAMVLEGVARTGRFDAVFLALLNGRKDRLVGRLGYGHGVGQYLGALEVPLAPGAGLLAEAALTRAPQVVAAGTPAMLVPRGAPAPEIPAAAIVAHPLIVRGKAVGVMVAARAAREPALDAADVTLVQLFCNQAALALDRAVH